jgi:hypothetical protein
MSLLNEYEASLILFHTLFLSKTRRNLVLTADNFRVPRNHYEKQLTTATPLTAGTS